MDAASVRDRIIANLLLLGAGFIGLSALLQTAMSGGVAAQDGIKFNQVRQAYQVNPVPVEAAPTRLPADTADGVDALALGRILSAAKFGDSQWPYLYKLWQKESNWNPAARNRVSGACGIPQALPCNKISDMSVGGQIEWGLDYIARRYGTPQKAWSFWLIHRYY